MGKKEKLSFVAYVLVGAAGLFTGFASDLVKDHGLPLWAAIAIGVTLTLASFVCVWIQTGETVKQEHARDARERRRYETLRDLIRAKAEKKANRRGRKLFRPDGGVNYSSALAISFGIYGYLAEEENVETCAKKFLSTLRASDIGQIIEKAIAEVYEASGTRPFGEQPWFELTNADDLQELADILAVSEIESDEEPEERDQRERSRY